MLPRPRRVTRADDFRRTMRRGRAAGRRRVVVHALAPTAVDEADAGSGVAGDDVGPARAGFVVGKAVGPAVVRHRVTRQLRHLVRERLGAVPAGTVLVVRAQPAAAQASSAELADDLDAALRRLGLGGRTGAPVDGQGRNR